MVRAGLFGDEREAARTLTRLVASGYDGTLVAEQTGGNLFFEIHVGPYSKLEDARQATIVLREAYSPRSHADDPGKKKRHEFCRHGFKNARPRLDPARPNAPRTRRTGNLLSHVRPKPNAPLADILVEENLLQADEILPGLCELLGLELRHELASEEIDHEVATRVSISFAKQHTLLPIALEDDDTLRVVTAQPLETASLDDLRLVFGVGGTENSK